MSGKGKRPPRINQAASGGKHRYWYRKFAVAGRGLVLTSAQASMRIHLVASVVVLVVASLLGIEAWRWAVVGLCITVVITAECFNTALEKLVHSLVSQHRQDAADVLDLAAAAVLAAAIGSSLVGMITLLPGILSLLRS